MLLLGRDRIFTDEKVINRDNIISVLKKAYSKHLKNAAEFQILFDFEKGIQPLVREKKVRSDINIEVHDDIANYIKKFHVGYFWSNPIMLVQRGNKETHETNSEVDSMGINALNEMLKNSENIAYKDQCMGEFVEIGGIGHKLVEIKTQKEFKNDTMNWTKDGVYTGSLVHDYILDSRYAFCVYHNGVGQKKLMGVTFVKSGGKLKFTCYTEDFIYEIVSWKIVEPVLKNPFGAVNIVEFERSFDRTGCFERNISEMNALNVMVSDFTNDVAQRTQEIWWGDNIEFPKDEKTGEDIKPQSGQWLLTYSADGKVAKIQPISSTLDNNATITAIDKQRSWILQKCNVPIQYDSSGGGSTGVAMDISSGWSDTEVAAMQKQQIVDKGKREELELILKAINLVPASVLPEDSPIRKVHSSDVEFKYNRKKNYDIATKSNAFATLVSHGINGKHALVVADMFQDIEQTWIDSKEGIEAYQNSVYNKQNTESTNNRNSSDLSDQTSNSPILSGV